MKEARVFVTSMGVVSAAGQGVAAAAAAMREGRSALAPLSLFTPGKTDALPVGELRGVELGELPRTHELALEAAREAMLGVAGPPDAVVLGGTTGGVPMSEGAIERGELVPEPFRLHGTGTVAETVARELGCSGPAFTVSTACSSGAVAVRVAMDLLRAGMARSVLAGGADALCRLTYHGFRTLQLIDPQGTRPLSEDRAGMTVGEGAAVLLLVAADEPPEGALAEVLGCGLSCDAHHPSAPHPEGAGAVAAMRAALAEARLEPAAVDYINMHGTGTPANDIAEAKAIREVFEPALPPISSTKGIFGHSLAAAGAVEAVLSVLTLQEGLLPPNVGCQQADPELGFAPIPVPTAATPRVVLSNSFGFGGNNAALLVGRADLPERRGRAAARRPLKVLGSACLTGVGHTADTLAAFESGTSCAGVLDRKLVTQGLPPRALRRLKRLPRMTLALGTAALGDAGEDAKPRSIFVGTGWGAVSETYDFLAKLFQTEQVSASPIDFVGSVHNSLASLLAIRFGARGPNLTTTHGDASFEQGVLTAALYDGDEERLLCGADEAQEPLTPLLDASARAVGVAADGGGALLVRRADDGEAGPLLRMAFLGGVSDADPAAIVTALGGPERIREEFARLFVGIPAAHAEAGEGQLARFLEATGFEGEVTRYRELLGEFATASATACVLAARIAARDGVGVLLLGLGSQLTALEVTP